MRLKSLDIVRGMTVAGMILVNNGYGPTFEPLRHAQWNGLTLSDLVFPFFLFIMGVSLYLSMSGRGLHYSRAKMVKILKRSALLFLFGILINWIDLAIGHGEVVFDNLRFWAVMQRIALCYLIAGVFALTVSASYTIPFAVLLLITYAGIIEGGGGYEYDAGSNILHTIDAFIFGEAHLYHKSPVDPEGLLSTMSAVTNVLFGFYCGMKIKQSGSFSEKVTSLFMAGTLLTFAGLLLNYGLPFNKRIWSPSFALVTSGLCALLLAVVTRWVDSDDTPRGRVAESRLRDSESLYGSHEGRWSLFFQAFGANALVLYLGSELISIFFARFGVSDLLYACCASLTTAGNPGLLTDSAEALQWTVWLAKAASLLYACCMVLINYLIAWPLFRHRIYIKL